MQEKKSSNKVGVIIAITDLNVKVLLENNDIEIKDILYTNYDGIERTFEVVESAFISVL